MLSELATRVERVKPILDQLKPQDWLAAGAPETYVTQWKSAQAEVGYLVRSSQALAHQPDRLTLTLETFFRMQAVESMLASLSEGVRKYQNPAVADLLQGAISETGASRDKLHQYLVDLAATKEQEFKTVDEEAQRCRAMLSRTPPKSAKPAPKKPEHK